MKSGTQVAVAAAAGYFLGRRRRLKLAIVLGAAVFTGGLGGAGGKLLRKGMDQLGSGDALGKISPELGEIVDTIRDDLMGAAKGAAITAVNSRIDSLSSNLRGRAEALRHPEDVAQDVQDVVGRVVPGGEEAEEAEEEEEQGSGEAAATASRRGGGRAGRAGRQPSAEVDEEADEELGEDEEHEEYEEYEGEEGYEDEEEAAPVRARSRATRTAGGASPIRRARR